MPNISQHSHSRFQLDVKEWFFRADIRVIQGIPFGCASVLLFAWPAIVKIIYADNIPKDLDWAHMPYVSFLLSLIGFVGILRKEFYWSPRITLKDRWAIIVGAFMILVCIIFGVLMLFFC